MPLEFFQVGDRRYARFARLSRIGGLSHAFSTRPHDVSARSDARAAERHARRVQMARDLRLDPDRLAHCVQAHRTRIATIAEPRAAFALEDCDGVVTAVAGTPIMTFSADCPLVIAYDPARRAVGLAHASWRCTVAQIVRDLVTALGDRFGCRPSALHCGIGPSAGPESYEVKQDVWNAAVDLAGRDELFRRRDGRLYFDLWAANVRQLVECGVPAEQIEIAGIDTMQDDGTFYSFRREGAGCGHFGLMAGLLDSSAGAEGEV